MRKLVNADTFREKVPVRTHTAKVLLGHPVALPRRRHFAAEPHHLAHEPLIRLHKEVPERSRIENKLVDLVMQISASDSETKKQDGPRTVHAKDQMSLAPVGGGLTEWTTSSNLSSGAQTPTGVQKGRDCSSTRMATYYAHPNADDGHTITILTITKIQNLRSQRRFMKGRIFVGSSTP